MYQAAMANNIDQMTEDILEKHYPLHAACMRGDYERVKQLVYNGFQVDQEDGMRAWTPMHWAANGGHWKCLALLREFYGVGMDVQNKRINQTPAHLAAMASQAECISWMVQNCGISPGMQLDCLQEVGQHRAGNLELLEKRNGRTGETPAHLAAQGGHAQCLLWLLQVRRGVGNVDTQQDYLGDTPLHKAARLGNLECVKLLTSHGPALSIFNFNGHTPLDVAALSGHHECKVFLEQAMSSQHTSFFPTASSPILMNGEGIYQRQSLATCGAEGAEACNSQDMEMGEEAGGGGAAAIRCSSGFKRSLEDEEDISFKRPRLFASEDGDRMGTSVNNNVVSSYNAVLAMSAEPSKPQPPHHNLNNGTEQVHAMPGQVPKPCIPYPTHPGGSSPGSAVNAYSSFLDHCQSIQAQHGYDVVMARHTQIEMDHGT